MTRAQKAAFKATIMKSLEKGLSGVMPGTLNVRYATGDTYIILTVHEPHQYPTSFLLSIKESQ